MVDYIFPSDLSERLSDDVHRKIVVRKTYVIERMKDYRYTFDLSIDDFPKIFYVDLAISRMEQGKTTVWKELYSDLVKQIKEHIKAVG